VADAHEAVRQDVEQKAAQKGLSFHGGDPGGVAVGAVLPAEGHLTCVEGDEPVVGEGDAMSVAGQVGEDLIGAGERGLADHHPACGGRAREQGVRVFIALPGNLGAIDGGLERGQELSAEDLGEDPHRQKEVRAGGDPVGVAGIEPAAGDDAAQMRVKEQELGPGVQDGGEGDLGAQAAEGDLRCGIGSLGLCAIGSWGGRRPRPGGDVTVTGATDGAAAGGGR